MPAPPVIRNDPVALKGLPNDLAAPGALWEFPGKQTVAVASAVNDPLWSASVIVTTAVTARHWLLGIGVTLVGCNS
jgi:hypothetical protein